MCGAFAKAEDPISETYCYQVLIWLKQDLMDPSKSLAECAEIVMLMAHWRRLAEEKAQRRREAAA